MKNHRQDHITGLADIHAHFVYGMDDGARTREDMEAMLDAAYADGITSLVATPHMTPGIKPFNPDIFRLRLEETARQARAHGFDFFGTTLTVSPHKDAQRLNAIGAELAQQYGVRWLPSDFKKREGYKRSIELSKQYGLYRQEYCGCLYSKPVDNAAAVE